MRITCFIYLSLIVLQKKLENFWSRIAVGYYRITTQQSRERLVYMQAKVAPDGFCLFITVL